jgi:SatD family (SatD)
MKGKKYLILMGDVIGSRNKDQSTLINGFKEIIQMVNKEKKTDFLSPMTITLGDEFQSVINDLPAALDIILKIEEKIVAGGKDFKLRYILEEGEIETPLNHKIAYGMLGSGLTSARERLESSKNDKARFVLQLVNKKRSRALNAAFLVFQGIIDDWKINKDYTIIGMFLQHKDYKQVAEQAHKDRSLMWKRARSLKLDEYFAIKEIIKYIGEGPNI